MKKIIIILFIFMFPIVVKANSINSIDMDIFIDNNGNARITEVWDAYLDSGTEGFHSYGNIGESYISDLSVSMNGKNFEIVDTWNVEYNMTAKENKAYIGSALDGEYGVYFGISRYGHNKYIISYTINNFIVKLKDANMLYWNLVPQDMGSAIGSVDITIYGDKEYSNSLDVWGYGKYGALAYVDKGKIHMKADNVLQSEYLTLLVKYPSDMFNAGVKINKNFNSYLKMAEKGAVNYNDKINIFMKILGYLLLLVFLLPVIIIIFVFKKIKFGKTRYGLNGYHTQGSSTYQNKRCDFGETGNVVDDDILPYRDIPTEDIFRAYWLVYNYNLGRKDEDILGALLLKWISQGYVKIEKENNDTNIIFISKPNNVEEMESKIYNYFYQASMGDLDNIEVDKKLSKDEFSNWCSLNINIILNWFSDVLDKEVNELIKEKKIRTERVSFYKNSYDLKYIVDSSMMEEAKKVAGLKKFLEEFSIINEREPLEVKIFDKYLIYAAMFGIADKVYDKFKSLYPDLIEMVNFDNIDVSFVYDVLENTEVNFNDSRNYSNTITSSDLNSARSYTSGGGGFSSSGGGGDSFGSGSSGGFR